MVKDYVGIRTKFWSDFEDALFDIVMKSVFYNRLNEIAFIRVMNQFMDYEEIKIFDDIYVVRPRRTSVQLIRNELLDTFSLYCSDYPECDSLCLLQEFKRRHIFRCPQDFQAFSKRVYELLRQDESNEQQQQ